ncbi:hypothetical protein [Ruminococcus flavefaciens]|uniref:hypothetical protein n=1 Tax=Ruminococcus flavefaciens TaxID=1265 RepID=UPI000463D4F4|nr:hypothetical protein [Ruminococcus flavefaciens]
MNKKKIFIILLSIITAFFLLFSSVWLFCYHIVWKPHIPTDVVGLKIDKDSKSRHTYYSTPDDEKYRQFTFSVPWYGNFHCVCSYTSGINFDENNFVINDDGEKEIIPTPISGSKFIFSIIMPISMSGKAQKIICDIQPMPNDEKYAESAYFELDINGKLQNMDNYSKKEIALYNDSLPEVLEIIDLMKEQFDF